MIYCIVCAAEIEGYKNMRVIVSDDSAETSIPSEGFVDLEVCPGCGYARVKKGV